MKLCIGGFSKRFHQQDKTGYQELILGQRFSLHIHVQGPNYSYQLRAMVLTIMYFHPGTTTGR
jgi:hypothetical protein